MVHTPLQLNRLQRNSHSTQGSKLNTPLNLKQWVLHYPNPSALGKHTVIRHPSLNSSRISLCLYSICSSDDWRPPFLRWSRNPYISWIFSSLLRSYKASETNERTSYDVESDKASLGFYAWLINNLSQEDANHTWNGVNWSLVWPIRWRTRASCQPNVEVNEMQIENLRLVDIIVRLHVRNKAKKLRVELLPNRNSKAYVSTTTGRGQNRGS